MRLGEKKKNLHLHFVGIGGIGMSGIAEVFFNQGYTVSGSDIAESEVTRHLVHVGLKVSTTHRAENVQGAQVVVISSAVKQQNPEVIEARRLRIPVIPRAEMLGELMRGKVGVAVAGTHGKTTTTSMLATIFTQAGADPTLVIGGKVDSLGGNAKLGQGEFVIAEADESDGSFLRLPATYGVVTNIDNDHLDHYGSLASVEDAFVEFVAHLPFYGMAAVCAEDEGVRRVLSRFGKPVVTYGFSSNWDYSAEGLETLAWGTRFQVLEKGKLLGTIELQVPGRHNVLNALGAIAVALSAGIEFKKVAAGIREFKGVRRRFEVKWRSENGKQLIVDDYGHHPTEIKAVLAAARSFWKGRIVTVFQPHRYSRTLHCREEFYTAFGDTDVLLMTDIYAAGEEPLEGVSSALLVDGIRKAGSVTGEYLFVGDLDHARQAVLDRLGDGDLVICLGAGSITRLPDSLVESLARHG